MSDLLYCTYLFKFEPTYNLYMTGLVLFFKFKIVPNLIFNVYNITQHNTWKSQVILVFLIYEVSDNIIVNDKLLFIIKYAPKIRNYALKSNNY